MTEFRITDHREEAIRARAAESVLWSEDGGRVPTRIADALWAAVRDRETLLATLDARSAPDGLLARSMRAATYQHGGADWRHAPWCRLSLSRKDLTPDDCDCGLTTVLAALSDRDA